MMPLFSRGSSDRYTIYPTKAAERAARNAAVRKTREINKREQAKLKANGGGKTKGW